MRNKYSNKNGFAVFAALIAVTLVAIVGTVGYVMLNKKPVSSVDQALLYSPAPSAAASPQTTAVQTVPDDTPVPTVSSSSDMQTIGKEIDQTTVGSVDAEFKNMNSSASSL